MATPQQYAVPLVFGNTPRARAWLDRQIESALAPRFSSDPLRILCNLETEAERRFKRSNPPMPRRVWVQAFVDRSLRRMYRDHDPRTSIIKHTRK